MTKKTESLRSRLMAAKLIRGILPVAILALSSSNIFGLGFLIPNQDAAAEARGNAFAATADDPSAIFYNPAGISQLPGQEVQVGVLNYFGINVSHDAPGSHASTEFINTPVPQVFYTVSPTNMPLSFGLGIYAPFGLGVDWPGNSGFRSLALNSKLLYITVSPVVSWQVTKTLSFAVGPTFNYSHIKFSRGLVSPTDYFEFKGDDYAFGMTAGILWRPAPQWSFGADYKLATTMDYDGNSTYTPAPGGPTFTTKTKADVEFPQIASGGVSYRPTPKWNLEADVDYINWNTLGTVTLAGTKNIFGFDLPLQLNWHDSWQYKFGVTRYFENGWFASIGYFFSSDTTSSQYYTPAVPDTDLNVGSIGVGHKGQKWDWALAAQIITGPDRHINQTANNTSLTGESAAGDYQLFVPAATFSVAYHF